MNSFFIIKNVEEDEYDYRGHYETILRNNDVNKAINTFAKSSCKAKYSFSQFIIDWMERREKCGYVAISTRRNSFVFQANYDRQCGEIRVPMLESSDRFEVRDFDVKQIEQMGRCELVLVGVDVDHNILYFEN